MSSFVPLVNIYMTVATLLFFFFFFICLLISSLVLLSGTGDKVRLWFSKTI